MEVFNESPKSDSFIPLSEHQSATPASFYSGPPVLHYYSQRCKVVILELDLKNSPAIAVLSLPSQHSTGRNGSAINGGEAHVEETEAYDGVEKVIEGVDVWVTSEKLLLFSSEASKGISIPYPAISLHAIQSLPEPTEGEQQGLYMQLVSASPDPDDMEEDDDPDSISLTIIPTAPNPPSEATVDTDMSEDRASQSPILALFTALSNCSNLHPDPIDPNEQDQADLEESTLFQAGMIAPGGGIGTLPPPMPGSGGWITAENMDEYVDEQGNWIGEKEGEEAVALGPGAGTVRTREDGDEDHEEGVADGQSDETKWRRTD